MISGWEGSPFDLRSHRSDPPLAGALRPVIPPEVAASLRSLTSLDTDGERLVFRASVSHEGIVLSGDEDALDDLLGYIAAEANHETDRRRQKRLDAAFQAMNDILSQPPRR